MTAAYLPSGAAEFPNDNPALHDGVRWVCLRLRGPARALWQPRAGLLATLSAPPLPSPTPALAEEKVASAPPAAPVERRYEGPLQIDLGRIVLPHRVENVPPPPDFIFRPFVSSRRRDADGASESAVWPRLAPISPRPCRVVDEIDACRRVDRRFRVDVAPCVDIEALGASIEAQRRGRRRSVVPPAREDSEAPLAAVSA